MRQRKTRQRRGADRAQGMFRLATNAFENIRSPVEFQLAMLARRLAEGDAATLAAIPAIILGGVRQ